MTDTAGKSWKLQCNNKKCSRIFEVSGREFLSNTGIRCPHCGKSSQYRTSDYIKQNVAKEVSG